MGARSIHFAVAIRFSSRKKWALYLRILFPSLLILVGSTLGFLGVLSYRTVHPPFEAEMGNPASYLLPYQDLRYASREGSHSLWFIPGSKGAPSIFLCHDYGSNRVSLLNLATLLRESGYNVVLVAFRGHGEAGFSRSTLGLREGDDLASAISFTIMNLPVHESRVGAWGVSLGAHAAIRAALRDERVQVLVLDSPYPSVFGFLNYQVAEKVRFETRLLGAVIWAFSSFYLWTSPAEMLEDVDVRALFPRRILYIAGLEMPSFARWTRALYARTEGPKDILILQRSRKSILTSAELKEYDLRVLDFFQRHLPL